MTLSFATALAHQCSAGVHLVHVNEYVVGGRCVPLATDEEVTHLVLNAVHQLQAAGIRTTGSVRRAPYRQVAHCIVAAADRTSADAIVLGSRRARRLGRLFSSQVRERTVRLTAPRSLRHRHLSAFPSHPRLDIADSLPVGHNRRQRSTQLGGLQISE